MIQITIFLDLDTPRCTVEELHVNDVLIAFGVYFDESMCAGK